LTVSLPGTIAEMPWRPVGMLVLDLDRFACDARCLRGVGGGAKGFLGLLLYACLVLSRRILRSSACRS
jgi:hypothetical protein